MLLEKGGQKTQKVCKNATLSLVATWYLKWSVVIDGNLDKASCLLFDDCLLAVMEKK